MVRVGGGWITLASFLENNDPCRGAMLLSTEFEKLSSIEVRPTTLSRPHVLYSAAAASLSHATAHALI